MVPMHGAGISLRFARSIREETGTAPLSASLRHRIPSILSRDPARLYVHLMSMHKFEDIRILTADFEYKMIFLNP